MAEPVRVGAVLATLPGLAGPLAEARLLAAWPVLAGSAAARTRPQGVEDGVLRVAVDSSGWLHRLTLEAPRAPGALPGGRAHRAAAGDPVSPRAAGS